MATSPNAAHFKLALDKIYDEVVEEEVVRVTKKLALEALKRVIQKSPVKTGQFRGNWNVSVEDRDEKTTTDRDPEGTKALLRGIATINGLGKARPIFVTNALPYAMRLENGYSKQAPLGMVAVTFAELQSIARV